jgi:glycerophosphoryl diester phosphodiesterase
MDDRPLLAVAHRAGNNLADLRTALAAGVDLVEADVHLYRGALEVRHRKAIGPHLYWEQWTEIDRRRSLTVPELHEVLAVAAGDPRLMLDLKGPSLAVAPRVAAALRTHAPGVALSVCTKQWRMLDSFAADPHIGRVLSAGDPVQLNRLRARLRRERAYGVSIRLSLLTPGVVAELRRATDRVLAWPVDTEEALARARRAGVTGVISKNLPMLKAIVAERAGRPLTSAPRPGSVGLRWVGGGAPSLSRGAKVGDVAAGLDVVPDAADVDRSVVERCAATGVRTCLETLQGPGVAGDQ